jgi:adenylyltransferase/sulfurtransferase
VTEAIRLIVSGQAAPAMTTFDVWQGRFRSVDFSDGRRAECVTCGLRRFEFLEDHTDAATTLCGRNTVQLRLPSDSIVEPEGTLLDRVEKRTSGMLRETERSTYLLRGRVSDRITLSIFHDGRVLVHGTGELAEARAVLARLIG